MLRQENVSAQEHDAARVRLTMDELARAVARYETRKMEETATPPDTMMVGEAIEQLSLNATPEEILAEVESGRERERQQARLAETRRKEQEAALQEKTEARSMRRKLAMVGALLGVSALLNLALFVAVIEGRRSMAVLPKAAFIMLPDAPPMPAASTPEMAMADAVTLSSVQEGQGVFANQDTVHQLANGKSPTKITVHSTRERNGTMWNSEWMLIKLSDKWYVRGWAMPQAAYNGSHAYNFLSNQSDMSDTTPRTVPIEKFKNLFDPAYVGEDDKVRGVFIPE